MSDASEILKSVQIGLDVVIFFLNTNRGLHATELCSECVILLQNLGSGGLLDICDVIFDAYHAMSGHTIMKKYAVKLFDTLNQAGILTLQLGDKYGAQNRFFEAKKLFKGTLTIRKIFGHKRAQALAHGRLRDVFTE